MSDLSSYIKFLCNNTRRIQQFQNNVNQQQNINQGPITQIIKPFQLKLKSYICSNCKKYGDHRLSCLICLLDNEIKHPCPHAEFFCDLYEKVPNK